MATPVELAWTTFGSGRPIVILHGLFGSKRNWRGIAQRLGEDYRVVTVDLRNHGESPHTPDMDYAAMAADIGGLLEHLELDDVDLIGHSMGGKAAMTYALSNGTRLGRAPQGSGKLRLRSTPRAFLRSMPRGASPTAASVWA